MAVNDPRLTISEHDAAKIVPLYLFGDTRGKLSNKKAGYASGCDYCSFSHLAAFLGLCITEIFSHWKTFGYTPQP